MNREHQLIYQAGALVLAYPDEQLLERLPTIREAVASTSAGPDFEELLGHLEGAPTLRELQEFHVQEFDLSRRHALHLTYWTDGDTRRRGGVLAALKQTYRDSGLLVDLHGELPDYLPMVLEFAATGDFERGVAILNSYRASLELLRIGCTEDRLPHAGVVKAVCDTLPGASPRTRAEVQKMLGEVAPAETVGLDAYPSPAGLLAGSGSGLSCANQMG